MRWMESHGGAIVNIIADIWNGWPNFAHSGAARGGMLTLSESAACEAVSGVRVNTVAPGGVARVASIPTRRKEKPRSAATPLRCHCNVSAARQKPRRLSFSFCRRRRPT
jgi:NAD(P)-dependent dehydrogenase (short-subunit alcohol dehydrogenase family)